MITELLADPAWDKPFFKLLAKNDTGSAVGHQGGAAIPKEIRKYFPSLIGTTSAANPTIDFRILADLYLEDSFVGRVDTRYQIQTWGGTRTPETRLTDNLGAIRNMAVADDLLLIQRNLVSLDLYRLILVRKTNAEYSVLKPQLGSKRWGVFGQAAPMTQQDFATAKQLEETSEAGLFQLFDPNANKIQTHSLRIARSVYFRDSVKKIYSGICTACGISLCVPTGASDFEAAHIVPRSQKGADDARNGLGLCRRHHWAFDNGLFGINTARKVYVPRRVRAMPRNSELVALHGQQIVEPQNRLLRPDDSALTWHMENLVSPFD